MLRKILLLCTVVLISGCTQQRLKKELELFSQTPIEIPLNMEVVQNGTLCDSLSRKIPRQTKLIIYYASEGCSSCAVTHLFELEELFELQVDRDRFAPMVILSPTEKNYKEIITLLKCQPHNYPVYIDKGNEFKKKNINLPDDTRFHTFLLDKDNKIVLVGDPLSGKNMWILFKSTLDNMLAHDGVYVPEK